MVGEQGNVKTNCARKVVVLRLKIRKKGVNTAVLTFFILCENIITTF